MDTWLCKTAWPKIQKETKHVADYDVENWLKDQAKTTSKQLIISSNTSTNGQYVTGMQVAVCWILTTYTYTYSFYSYIYSSYICTYTFHIQSHVYIMVIV